MNVIDFRRHIHRHPDISWHEHSTAEFIAQSLRELGLEPTIVAKTGVLVKIEGEGDLSQAIILRADIDALPIAELNEVDFCSINSGVMHACGHDMHAAMLYGAVVELTQNRSFEGTIFALFQPAEESNPGGASVVLSEEPFEGYKIHAAIAQHVDSRFAVGEFGFRKGKYMASNDELRFKVHGVGGHGALRSLLKDAVVAAAELTIRVNQLNSDECVVSIGRFIAEGATNVVPNDVYMEGTLRTYNEQQRAIIHQRLRNIAEDIHNRTGVEIEVDINCGYPSVVVDELLWKHATSIAKQMNIPFQDDSLRPTSEDFGFFTQRYPSLFYRIGVGKEAGRTHTATFLPSEEALEHGVKFLTTLARKLPRK